MEKLIEALKKVLATSFAFRLKAQYYHWNIEGPDFYQYHDLLGDLYEEVDSAVDSIAEHIRTLNSYSPGSFGRYMELSLIEDENSIPTAIEMLNRLYNDNSKVIEILTLAYHQAEQLSQLGISNYLQDRIDIHNKHAWMLRSTLKRNESNGI